MFWGYVTFYFGITVLSNYMYSFDLVVKTMPGKFWYLWFCNEGTPTWRSGPWLELTQSGGATYSLNFKGDSNMYNTIHCNTIYTYMYIYIHIYHNIPIYPNLCWFPSPILSGLGIQEIKVTCFLGALVVDGASCRQLVAIRRWGPETLSWCT